MVKLEGLIDESICIAAYGRQGKIEVKSSSVSYPVTVLDERQI